MKVFNHNISTVNTLVSIELSNRWIHFKSHIVIHAGMQQQKTAFYINSYWYKNLKVLFYYKSTLNSLTPLDCAQFMFYDTWLPPLYLCIIIVCGFFKIQLQRIWWFNIKSIIVYMFFYPQKRQCVAMFIVICCPLFSCYRIFRHKNK